MFFKPPKFSEISSFTPPDIYIKLHRYYKQLEDANVIPIQCPPPLENR